MRAITLSTRARIFGRFRGPTAESEITVKKLGAKFAKLATQGSKARRSYFTLKLDFRNSGGETRVLAGKYDHEIGRRFIAILEERNRLENSRYFSRNAKSRVGNNSARVNSSLQLRSALEVGSGIRCRFAKAAAREASVFFKHTDTLVAYALTQESPLHKLGIRIPLSGLCISSTSEPEAVVVRRNLSKEVDTAARLSQRRDEPVQESSRFDSLAVVDIVRWLAVDMGHCPADFGTWPEVEPRNSAQHNSAQPHLDSCIAVGRAPVARTSADLAHTSVLEPRTLAPALRSSTDIRSKGTDKRTGNSNADTNDRAGYRCRCPRELRHRRELRSPASIVRRENRDCC